MITLQDLQQLIKAVDPKYRTTIIPDNFYGLFGNKNTHPHYNIYYNDEHKLVYCPKGRKYWSPIYGSVVEYEAKVSLSKKLRSMLPATIETDGRSISRKPGESDESWNSRVKEFHESIKARFDAEAAVEAKEKIEPTPADKIQEELHKLEQILLAKNTDYDCNAWKKPILCPQLDSCTAIEVRMSDKIGRLTTLLSGEKPKVDESVEDTMRDLAGYCILWLANPNRGK